MVCHDCTARTVCAGSSTRGPSVTEANSGMQKVTYSHSKLTNRGFVQKPPEFYGTFLQNCHFEVSNNHLKSDRHQQSLLIIGQIFQKTNIFSRLQYEEKWFESIDILVQILQQRGSINDGDAQIDEFGSRFIELMPTKLGGVESVWRHVFEYHYSAAAENADISQKCCEMLMLVLATILEWTGTLWDENNHSNPHAMRVSQISRIMLAIVNAAHKYSSNDVIAECALMAFFDRATNAPCEDDWELIQEQLKLIIMPFTMIRITNREFILTVFMMLNPIGIANRRVHDLLLCLADGDYMLAELMLEIILAHECDLDVVRLAFSILSRMMQNKTHDVRIRMVAANADELILHGMNMFRQDPAIAMDGCLMIMVLAEYCPLSKVRLGSIGACEAVADAFTTHYTMMRGANVFRPVIRHLAHGNNQNKLRLQAAGAGDFCPQLNISGWLDNDSEDEQGGDY